MDKNLLSQLRDIDGLDAIAWWPPAPGWWLMLATFVLMGMALWYFMRRSAKPPAWKRQVLSALSDLRRETDNKRKAALLSALLRQMAMERHGRRACAGLEGSAWLDWLAQHDPAQFDWRKKGKVIVEAPYAPASPSPQELDPLIDAAEKWV